MKNLLKVQPSKGFAALIRKDGRFEATAYDNMEDFLESVGVLDFSKREAREWAEGFQYCELIQTSEQLLSAFKETKNSLAVMDALSAAGFDIIE